jgi:hypothetical protein
MPHTVIVAVFENWCSNSILRAQQLVYGQLADGPEDPDSRAQPPAWPKPRRTASPKHIHDKPDNSIPGAALPASTATAISLRELFQQVKR